jgi:hypothetical protein
MKIFVSVAGYRDSELPKTLQNFIENARYPKDINFAVLSQDYDNKHPDLSFVKNLNYLKMNFRESRGAGYARKLLMDQYNGEDIFFQIDSHMRADKNWDVRLLTMLSEAQELAQTEKVILSQFPGPYKVLTNGKDEYTMGDMWYWSDPSWTRVVRTESDVWAGNREKMEDTSKPHPSHTILAAYVFAPGSIVEEVPYDERISFMGEELCFAIRAYTRGWKIYAPNEMLLWHYYVRKSQPKVWSQRDDASRNVKNRWQQVEKQSRIIQKRVLTGEEKGVFGIADKKLYEEYQKMIGINFNEFYKYREY